MSIDAQRMKVEHYEELILHPDCIVIGGKVKLPAGRVTREQIDGVLAMKVIPGDIFITSYPKTGTTWLQAIVWWVINVQKVHAQGGSIESMEGPTMSDLKRHHHRFIDLNGAENVDQLPTPRVLVTHLPYDIVSKLDGAENQVKYFHVIRDPKDAIVSYFHMVQMIYKVPDGDFNCFVDHFIKGTGIYGDFFDTVKTYWDRRYDPNVLLVFYEEMLANPGKQILRIANFLSNETTNYHEILESNQEIVQKIIEATTLKSMKETHLRTLDENSKPFADFFRKGVSGDFKNYLNASQVSAINDRIKNELGQPFVHMYVKRNS